MSNQGNDQGLLEPVWEQLSQRDGRCPPEMLTDGAYATVEAIQATAASGSRLFAVPKPPNPAREGQE